MGEVEVNKHGYLVKFNAPDGKRDYACADLPALKHLIERLTGRKWETFMLDERGLPEAPVLFTIAYPLHIYRWS